MSGGLHGVGLFVVGCVSTRLTAEVWRDGGHYRVLIERGFLTEPLARQGGAHDTGTCIRWLPDPQVFGDLAFDRPRIRLRLRELAFLNPAVTLTFHDERQGWPVEVFREPDGAVAFGQFLNAGRETIGPVIPFGGRQGDIEIEGALQYRADSGTVLACYANMVRMNSGIHETTLFAGLTRALNRQARRLEVALPGGRALRRVQTQHGLTAVVSLKLERPLNTSATRTRLENPQVVAPLQRAVRAALDAALDAEPHIARLILAHIRNAKPPTDTGLAWHRFW